MNARLAQKQKTEVLLLSKSNITLLSLFGNNLLATTSNDEYLVTVFFLH